MSFADFIVWVFIGASFGALIICAFELTRESDPDFKNSWEKFMGNLKRLLIRKKNTD